MYISLCFDSDILCADFAGWFKGEKLRCTFLHQQYAYCNQMYGEDFKAFLCVFGSLT